MDADFHERVRKRAHQLWLQDGCPEGRGEEHWQQAQREIHGSTVACVEVAEQARGVAATSDSTPDDQTGSEPAIAVLPQISAPSMLSVPAKGRGMPLLKVGSGQCRYIVSETYSPAICCGAPSGAGSWCKEHQTRVFARVPAKPLRLDRLEKRQAEWARF